MDSNDIRALAEIMKKNDVTRLDFEQDFEDGCTKIVMERLGGAVPETVNTVVQTVQTAVGDADIAQTQQIVMPNVKTVRSPMVGVFYAAKAPGAKPFVKEGDAVQIGQVMCIIEAMKLMNDITSDVNGIVSKVCVKDGDVVEFGQVLFELE